MKKIGVAFNEPSTWRAVGVLLAAFGLGVEQSEAITVAGLTFAGLVGAFVKDTPAD